MEDYSDTMSNKSYMLVNAEGPNFSRNITMPLRNNCFSSTMNMQPNFNSQWYASRSQRYYTRDTNSVRSVADFRTGDLQRYQRERRCASPMSVRSTATNLSERACALVETLQSGEFNSSDRTAIYKAFVKFFNVRRNRKTYKRNIRQTKARRISRDETSSESSEHDSDSSDCMSTRTVRTAKTFPRNTSKENMRRTLHYVRNDIKNGNVFWDRSGELQYNSLKRAVSSRLGNPYLDTSDSEPNPVSMCMDNVSRVRQLASRNDCLPKVASVCTNQFKKPMPVSNSKRRNISQNTNVLNNTWATQKERFENSLANNNTLFTSQKNRFENCQKAISAQASVNKTTKQNNDLDITKSNTLSTNALNCLSHPQASKKTGISSNARSSNKENTIQNQNLQDLLLTDTDDELFSIKKGTQNKTNSSVKSSEKTKNTGNELLLPQASKKTGGRNNAHLSNKKTAVQNKSAQRLLLTDSDEELFPNKEGLQHKTSLSVNSSQTTNNARNKTGQNKTCSVQSDGKKGDTNNFKVPCLPIRKSNPRKGEKLISKSSQPLHTLTDISPEKPQNDFSVCDTDRSEMSSRQNLTKRKLFSTKLSIIENSNTSAESASDSPNNKLYIVGSNTKNKTKKIAKNQSCLSRDINENEDVLDLLGKLMPGKKINVASSTLQKENTWDIQSILSNCNEEDVSDTFTDPEVLSVEEHSDCGGNNKNNRITSPTKSAPNSYKTKELTKKQANNGSFSSSDKDPAIKAKSKKYFRDKSGENTPKKQTPAKNSKQKTNKENVSPTKMYKDNVRVNITPLSLRSMRNAKRIYKKTATPNEKSLKQVIKPNNKVNIQCTNQGSKNTKRILSNKDDNDKEKFRSPAEQRQHISKNSTDGVNKIVNDNTKNAKLNKSKDGCDLNENNETRITRKRSRTDNDTSVNVTSNSDLVCERRKSKRLLDKKIDNSKDVSRSNRLNITFCMFLRPRHNRSSNMSTTSDPTSSNTFNRLRTLRSRQADILGFLQS